MCVWVLTVVWNKRRMHRRTFILQPLLLSAVHTCHMINTHPARRAADVTLQCCHYNDSSKHCRRGNSRDEEELRSSAATHSTDGLCVCLSNTVCISPQPACSCSRFCSTCCGWRWWMWRATSFRRGGKHVRTLRFQSSMACHSWWRLPECPWSSSLVWSSCWWAVRFMPASDLPAWITGWRGGLGVEEKPDFFMSCTWLV